MVDASRPASAGPECLAQKGGHKAKGKHIGHSDLRLKSDDDLNAFAPAEAFEELGRCGGRRHVEFCT